MEENTENMKVTLQQKKFCRKKLLRNIVLGTLATIIGYIHYEYVLTLYENHQNFSLLSNLEREMSLVAETGFYYSYYKTIVEERTLVSGMSKIMYDKLVEYPKEVNAFNRFNIYQEVIVGTLYRYLQPWLNSTHRECHMVYRHELDPVQSCVGIGEPIFFYLQSVWILAGVTAAVIFLYAVSLSESILGGFLATAQFFANHNEATRVMWHPNQRENFAFPFLLLQSWLLVLQLRDPKKRTAFQLQVSIFILNCLCLLAWQFTQFIFLTQTAIFFIMEQLKIIDNKSLCIFLHSHFCGLHMAVLLLQGNDMLKSSLYTSLFIVVSVYCLFFSSLRVKVQNRLDLFVETWLIMLRICIVFCASLYLKKVISDFLNADCDNHIWNILLAKFTNFKSYHTMIYTCMRSFDFLPWESVENLTKSSLIPIVLFTLFNITCYWLKDIDERYDKKTETEDEPVQVSERDNGVDDEDSGIENSESKCRKRKTSKSTNLDVFDKKIKTEIEKPVETDDVFLRYMRSINIDPGIFYCVAQMGVYGILTLLVMRLKLLFVPQMCIVASLAVNLKYYTILMVSVGPDTTYHQVDPVLVCRILSILKSLLNQALLCGNPSQLKNVYYLANSAELARVPKHSMKMILLFWIMNAVPLIFYLVRNSHKELEYLGEFQSPRTEDLLNWIMNNTAPSASFAASLSLLSTIMLTARRPIVAHPHYEDLGARQRAYSVYKVYGRFSPEEYYRELNKLQVSYLVVDKMSCYGRMSSDCSYADIWDVEYPNLASRPKLCHTLLTEPAEHFYLSYRNSDYSVFRIHDLSIRYMPRSFDT